MADPETITLRESGLVLRKRGSVYIADGTPISFLPNSLPGGSCPVAWCRDGHGTAFNDNTGALAWLDTRVLELRAALLPPGAIVVADTEETVERIARALAGKVRPLDQMSNWAQIRYHDDAATVLAALREAGR